MKDLINKFKTQLTSKLKKKSTEDETGEFEADDMELEEEVINSDETAEFDTLASEDKTGDVDISELSNTDKTGDIDISQLDSNEVTEDGADLSNEDETGEFEIEEGLKGKIAVFKKNLNSKLDELKAKISKKKQKDDSEELDEEDDDDSDEEDEDESGEEVKKKPKLLMIALIGVILYLALDTMEEESAPNPELTKVQNKVKKAKKKKAVKAVAKTPAPVKKTPPTSKPAIAKKKVAPPKPKVEPIKVARNNFNADDLDLDDEDIEENDLEGESDSIEDVEFQAEIPQKIVPQAKKIEQVEAPEDLQEPSDIALGEGVVENPSIEEYTPPPAEYLLQNENGSDYNEITEEILQRLQKRLNSQVASRDTEILLKKEPDYGKVGRGLVYSCHGKHWACLNAVNYFRCENNFKYFKLNKLQPRCFAENVYATEEDCNLAQQKMIDLSVPTNFCD